MSPGWVAATVAVAGALWGIGKVVFGVVSRAEMKEVIQQLRDETNEKHREIVSDLDKQHKETLAELNRKHRQNEQNFRESFKRQRLLETALVRVQERLNIPNRRQTDFQIGYEGTDEHDDDEDDGT